MSAVKITKVYTRGGDDGKTGLADGSRRAKYDVRIDALGAIDEANSALGAAQAVLEKEGARKEYARLLEGFQHSLFDLGAEVCSPGRREKPSFIEKNVEDLERRIDEIDETLAPPSNFVLPGGCLSGAMLHNARTAVRRAERKLWRLYDAEPGDTVAVRFLNRLSDLLFVMARSENLAAGREKTWRPDRRE